MPARSLKPHSSAALPGSSGASVLPQPALLHYRDVVPEGDKATRGHARALSGRVCHPHANMLVLVVDAIGAQSAGHQSCMLTTASYRGLSKVAISRRLHSAW